ncbi:hypothetical protein Tco_0520972 [Tanacetum coccineum]
MKSSSWRNKEAKTESHHFTQKDHDISLLDSRATHLESTLNDAQAACTEAGTKLRNYTRDGSVDFGMQEGLVGRVNTWVAGRSLSEKQEARGWNEVLDCFLLDGPLAELPEAASLQPCIEQLSIPIHYADDKTAVGETSLSFALMNVHARAEGAKKHATALRQLMMEIVSAPLSSQTWVG